MTEFKEVCVHWLRHWTCEWLIFRDGAQVSVFSPCRPFYSLERQIIIAGNVLDGDVATVLFGFRGREFSCRLCSVSTVVPTLATCNWLRSQGSLPPLWLLLSCSLCTAMLACQPSLISSKSGQAWPPLQSGWYTGLWSRGYYTLCGSHQTLSTFYNYTENTICPAWIHIYVSLLNQLIFLAYNTVPRVSMES
jgi:hypothetical protein